jgi:hypothetical protein
MKALIILADGTRYADHEVHEAALERGYVEFSREPRKPAEQPQPALSKAEYFVCLHDGNEDGVPVFRERRGSAPPAAKKKAAL